MITHYVAAGAGGAFGSIARLLLGKLLPIACYHMPIRILFINILGCFIMGLLTEFMALHWSPSDHVRYFWVSGFLGGFTTFSAFSLEAGLLFEKNELLLACLYIAFSVCFSLIFFFIGIRIVRWWP